MLWIRLVTEAAMKTAGRAVGNDDSGGDYHCRHVIKAEEAVEELAAGGKAGGV